MKRLLIIAALLLPLAAGAQDFDFGARASAGVDVKLRKGFTWRWRKRCAPAWTD